MSVKKSATRGLLQKDLFDALYDTYNKKEFVHPDPLEFLFDYPDLPDREIVGIIASSLAYGRVEQILKSVSSVLNIMNRSPYLFITETSEQSILERFAGFKHRFTTGEELALMLIGIKQVLEKYATIKNCFVSCYHKDDKTFLKPLTFLVDQLTVKLVGGANSLLPSPCRKSACKRLYLFLRWMIRHDHVDPGGWHDLPQSKLIIPLDVHMHRISRALGLTSRKQADMKTAVEITQGFKKISPNDPVRYDFALTRLGIRKDTDLAEFLNKLTGSKVA